jgi:hypothetical protein
LSRYGFISDHQATDKVYSVQRLCRVLKVTRSGFYAWLAGAQRRTERAGADAALVDRIRAIHTEVGGVYGLECPAIGRRTALPMPDSGRA